MGACTSGLGEVGPLSLSSSSGGLPSQQPQRSAKSKKKKDQQLTVKAKHPPTAHAAPATVATVPTEPPRVWEVYTIDSRGTPPPMRLKKSPFALHGSLPRARSSCSHHGARLIDTLAQPPVRRRSFSAQEDYRPSNMDKAKLRLKFIADLDNRGGNGSPGGSSPLQRHGSISLIGESMLQHESVATPLCSMPNDSPLVYALSGPAGQQWQLDGPDSVPPQFTQPEAPTLPLPVKTDSPQVQVATPAVPPQQPNVRPIDIASCEQDSSSSVSVTYAGSRLVSGRLLIPADLEDATVDCSPFTVTSQDREKPLLVLAPTATTNTLTSHERHHSFGWEASCELADAAFAYPSTGITPLGPTSPTAQTQ